MRVFSGNVKRKWQSGPPDLTWEIRRKPALRPLAGLCGQQLIHGSRSLMTGDAPHCVILLDHTHRACSSPVLSIVAPSPFSLPTYTPGCSRMHTKSAGGWSSVKDCLPTIHKAYNSSTTYTSHGDVCLQSQHCRGRGRKIRSSRSSWATEQI